MKILVITPVTSAELEQLTIEEMKKYVSDDLLIDVTRIKVGPSSIESAYDEALAAPGIIRAGEKAEEEGYDGIFVTCMGDPGVEALRERLTIPVVGPCRATFMYAAELSHKFSVVTVLEEVIHLFEKNAQEAGITSKLSSVKSISIPVLELFDPEKLLKALVEKSTEAILQDGAQAIVLGCTGMIGVDKALQASLNEKGFKVPILYPVEIAIRYLQSLILANLSQSKAAYMPVREKDRNIWELFDK